MATHDLDGGIWRKSSHSGGSGDCVEVAAIRHGIAVRDSKDPAGPTLLMAIPAWREFIVEVGQGEFDRR